MKKILMVIVALAIVGAGAGVVLMRDDKKDQQITTPPAAYHEPEEQEETEPAAETNSVSIEDFSFKSATITVKMGTKVTWANKDNARHTVTPDEDGAFQGSELLAQGDTFSVTFAKTGTFKYHCTPHPNMQGTVVVTE